MSPNKIVYVIDDDVVILELYKIMLKSDEYEVRTFNSGYKFMEAYDETIPSCALIDINMPDIDGLTLFKTMKFKDIDIPIIFMSSTNNVDYVANLFREGAFDFIEKPYIKYNLINDILLKALIYDEHKINDRKKIVEIREAFDKLSERETKILNLLSIGNSAKVIAKELGISYRTVETHIANIKSKTQLDTIKLISNIIYLQTYLHRNGVVPESHF